MANTYGFLVPPWFVFDPLRNDQFNLCCLLAGVEVSCAMFTCAKVIRHTLKRYNRSKKANAYIVIIWAEWVANIAMALLIWLYFRQYLPPSFWLFFSIVVVWVVQLQCILQIIINRVGLLVENKKFVFRMKLFTCLAIALINVSGFVIWIPARLQLAPEWMQINNVWDRSEKAIFATIDCGLNVYFIYSVRTKLIAMGLTKYTTLFYFNLCMATISVLLDVVLIASMSLSDSMIYVEFQAVIYMIKLHIELNLAELISAIVHQTNDLNSIPETGNTTSTLKV